MTLQLPKIVFAVALTLLLVNALIKVGIFNDQDDYANIPIAQGGGTLAGATTAEGPPTKDFVPMSGEQQLASSARRLSKLEVEAQVAEAKYRNAVNQQNLEELRELKAGKLSEAPSRESEERIDRLRREAEAAEREVEEKGSDAEESDSDAPPFTEADSSLSNTETPKLDRVADLHDYLGPIMQVIVTLTLLPGTLFVILSDRYKPSDKHWAYSTLGMVIGFWLKLS